MSRRNSSPTNPVRSKSEKVNPKRASLIRFGRSAKLSETTRLRVGLASVRGPEAWVGGRRNPVVVLEAEAAKELVPLAEVVVDADVELVGDLRSRDAVAS